MECRSLKRGEKRARGKGGRFETLILFRWSYWRAPADLTISLLSWHSNDIWPNLVGFLALEKEKLQTLCSGHDFVIHRFFIRLFLGWQKVRTSRGRKSDGCKKLKKSHAFDGMDDSRPLKPSPFIIIIVLTMTTMTTIITKNNIAYLALSLS